LEEEYDATEGKLEQYMAADEELGDDYEICDGDIERASDDEEEAEELDCKLTPQKRGRPPLKNKPVTRGRPAGKRIIEEEDEDEFLEADEQIADPDDDPDGEPEEDDESEYGVARGSRRKAKTTRKARGSATRGSKRGA
jgi:hypothetical protein